MKPGDLICTVGLTRMFSARSVHSADVVIVLNEGTVGLVIEPDPNDPGRYPLYDLVLAAGRLGYVWNGALNTRARADR